MIDTVLTDLLIAVAGLAVIGVLAIIRATVWATGRAALPRLVYYWRAAEPAVWSAEPITEPARPPLTEGGWTWRAEPVAEPGPLALPAPQRAPDGPEGR